jgi:hypothetical protein
MPCRQGIAAVRKRCRYAKTAAFEKSAKNRIAANVYWFTVDYTDCAMFFAV